MTLTDKDRLASRNLGSILGLSNLFLAGMWCGMKRVLGDVQMDCMSPAPDKTVRECRWRLHSKMRIWIHIAEPPSYMIHENQEKDARPDRKHEVEPSLKVHCVTKQRQPRCCLFNGRISGDEHAHRDHRTSWAPIGACRRSTECGHTQQKAGGAREPRRHRSTWRSRQRATWR